MPLQTLEKLHTYLLERVMYYYRMEERARELRQRLLDWGFDELRVGAVKIDALKRQYSANSGEYCGVRIIVSW